MQDHVPGGTHRQRHSGPGPQTPFIAYSLGDGDLTFAGYKDRNKTIAAVKQGRARLEAQIAQARQAHTIAAEQRSGNKMPNHSKL